ncbi:unnamed protein product [Phytophthora fragariaefolia]|uniref:Unnamed protein product n=1 Tax=Phytophthora fragariaefolia TaxID=1490495 RepID=A0A9W7CTK9_9STRA|nr:unnamed protein product [Phytophthora fragariaefolia]
MMQRVLTGKLLARAVAASRPQATHLPVGSESAVTLSAAQPKSSQVLRSFSIVADTSDAAPNRFAALAGAVVLAGVAGISFDAAQSEAAAGKKQEKVGALLGRN